MEQDHTTTVKDAVLRTQQAKEAVKGFWTPPPRTVDEL